MPNASARVACATALLLAVAASGCSGRTGASSGQAAPRPSRPATMPAESGRAVAAVGSALASSRVRVIVRVPARRMPAHLGLRSLADTGPWVLPAEETTFTAGRRFVGFRVASTEPTAGAALGATQTVVLVAGAHPGASSGATWFQSHPAVVEAYGVVGCYDAISGGTAGCHGERFCSDCHTGLMSR